MDKCREILSCLFLCLITSCGGSLNTEEAAVYRTYIDNSYAYMDGGVQPLKQIVIDQLTVGYHNIREYADKATPRPSLATIEDYFKRNGMTNSTNAEATLPRYRINPDMRFKLPYALVTEAELNLIFRKGDLHSGWKAFYNRYPNSHGIFQFSRVGFNSKKTEAVFYFANQYAADAGEGSFIFLNKSGKNWKVVSVVGIWAS